MKTPVLDAVTWFVHHIEFAFVVGIFVGVFLVDFGHSVHLSAKIRSFVVEHNIVVHFEHLKESVKEKLESVEHKKASFIFPFKSPRALREELDGYRERFKERRDAKKKE